MKNKALLVAILILNVVQAFGGLFGKSELPNNGTVGDVSD